MIIRHAPRESGLARLLEPVATQWTDTDYLLANAVDILASLLWAQAGRKGQKRPDPVLRPGDEPKNKKIGTTAVPMDEMAKILGWPMAA